MRLPLAVRVHAIGRPIVPAHITSANGRSVLICDCSDGIQRFCKGSDDNQFAPVNEWVSAMLAKLAGFSVLEPAIVDVGGRVFYGVPYFDASRASFGLAGAGDPLFLGSSNCDEILYQGIAFDAYIANPDRHSGNLIVVRD